MFHVMIMKMNKVCALNIVLTN